MLLATQAVLALGLTVAMFLSRNWMLGFPSAIFWFIFGGYCYTQSAATWDIYYFLFFASSLGMTVFCAVGAYGLREQRDTGAEDIDEDMKGWDKDFYGEESEKSLDNTQLELDRQQATEERMIDEPTGNSPSRRVRVLRERARRRRLQGVKPKTNWGEFK